MKSITLALSLSTAQYSRPPKPSSTHPSTPACPHLPAFPPLTKTQSQDIPKTPSLSSTTRPHPSLLPILLLLVLRPLTRPPLLLPLPRTPRRTTSSPANEIIRRVAVRLTLLVLGSAGFGRFEVGVVGICGGAGGVEGGEGACWG